LIIDVEQPIRLAVGRLGDCDFPAGRYVYTGSAKRALEARIARHLRKEKALHWHIDYLLAAAGVNVVAVHRSTCAECALNRRTKGAIVVAGFGASDCRAGCRSHLRYRPKARVSAPRAPRSSGESPAVAVEIAAPTASQDGTKRQRLPRLPRNNGRSDALQTA
jgi:Uri superfamily endonuclease